MATVTLKGVQKSYGPVHVIKGVDLAVDDREFCVFVGPSGCGKSTLLRMIAGLEEISSGELMIDGQRVNDVPPSERGLAMVFQSYALYPHMSVANNMAFSTASRKSSPAASGSGSRSGAQSSGTRGCSCSTSRSQTSMRLCGCRCASSSPASTTNSPPP